MLRLHAAPDFSISARYILQCNGRFFLVNNQKTDTIVVFLVKPIFVFVGTAGIGKKRVSVGEFEFCLHGSAIRLVGA